jgi:FMN-dependent NADH-azoreductase
VTVNRPAARPLHARGGTLTWREHRLRHALPDGSLQIGITLAGKPVVIVASRGGSYEPGTPREGMEFVKNYLAGVFSTSLGITPEFITIELTLATTVPAMAGLIPLAEQSRADALAAADAKARELVARLADAEKTTVGV